MSTRDPDNGPEPGAPTPAAQDDEAGVAPGASAASDDDENAATRPTSSTGSAALDAADGHGDDEGVISIRRVIALARPQWRPLALGTVFLIISAAMGLAYPQAVAVIMDSAIGEADRGMIDAAAMAMGVIFLVAGVTTALRSYLFTVAGERVVTSLRSDLYASVIAQEIAFFDKRRTGEILNRLASDTTVLQNTVSVNVSMALRHVATSFGGIVLLFVTSPRLTAIMLAVVPPVVIGAVVFGRIIRRLSRDVQDALASASEVAEETISGVRTVRAFAREPAEVARYGEAVERSFTLAKRRSAISAAFFGGVSFAGYASVALVLWYGGHMVIDDVMTVGELTAFVLYTLIVAVSIGALGGLWADFMKASGAAQRVFAILDRRPTIASGVGKRLGSLRAPVHIEGVTFRYPSRPDVVVLRELSMTLEPGRVVALVGPSGGGKSTIAALLTRFYDPDEGRIRVGDDDLRDLDPDWVREQIGVVSQEPILFSTTVAENIRYGRPDATDDEVRAAAEAAFAADFIEGFPNGYETLVGERGVQLSGGQKQRVAIARAILKDPGLLILDEATSALDAESEAIVQRALDRLMQGRTTLVIAHRLSTVRDADRVVVIDAGRVVEAGTHDELVAADGVYRKLVERQFDRSQLAA